MEGEAELEEGAELEAEAGDFLEEPREDFLGVEASEEEEVVVVEVMVVVPWKGAALVASQGTDFNHIECNFVMFRFYLIE